MRTYCLYRHPIVCRALLAAKSLRVSAYLSLVICVLGLSGLSGCETTPGNRLLTAATTNDLAAVKQLIESGIVEVNYSAPSNGESALTTASGLGHVELVEMLLQLGANPNMATKAGHTALMGAAYDGNTTILSMLIASGANLDAMEKTYGYTALAMAALKGRSSAIELLLRAGANPGLRTFAGKTPLQLALENNHREAFELLSSHGKSAASLPPNGRLPF